MRVSELPPARLDTQQINSIYYLTDNELADCCGIRIAFTGRLGGISSSSYASLNLATHLNDNPADVFENRKRVFAALGAQDTSIITAHQIHSDNLVFIDSNDEPSLNNAQYIANAGADGFIVTTTNVTPLLCFADCVPVIIVSPTGSFAVVHAGWRGVVQEIAAKAVSELAAYESGAEMFLQDDGSSQSDVTSFSSPGEACASYHVYIGPYLHAECFEVGEDVHDALVDVGGACCAPDEHHIDLGSALCTSLERVGIRRDNIADAQTCTACNTDLFYSYRGEGKLCGRHGALAFRKG